jgi:hypothetical protein
MRGVGPPRHRTMITLQHLTNDFAAGLKAVDATAPQGASRTRTYRPGVGPLTEAEAIRRAFAFMADVNPIYADAKPCPYPNTRQTCDIVLPGSWALEFKLIRPFGDNGVEAEHWSENILHPYPGNVSSIGDCLKLLSCDFAERKGIVVFGYEHTPPRIALIPAVTAFEITAQQVIGIELGPRYETFFGELIHPVHQQGWVYGWEVFAGH